MPRLPWPVSVASCLLAGSCNDIGATEPTAPSSDPGPADVLADKGDADTTATPLDEADTVDVVPAGCSSEFACPEGQYCSQAGLCVAARPDCTDGWCTIPPGSFRMGSDRPNPQGLGSNQPEYIARVEAPFLIGASEVTLGEWVKVTGDDYAPNLRSACGDDCPASAITVFGMLAFSNMKSAAEGLDECYELTDCDGGAASELECGAAFTVAGCTGYRLPTEIEWSLAARAGTTTCGPSGAPFVGLINNSCPPDVPLTKEAWFCANSDATHGVCTNCKIIYSAGEPSSHITSCCGMHPVAQKLPNGFGLHDVVGNVWEVVWGAYALFPLTGVDLPMADSETGLVALGGSYDLPINVVCVFTRAGYGVYQPSPQPTFGFRIARSLP